MPRTLGTASRWRSGEHGWGRRGQGDLQAACQVAEWVNARCRNWGLWRMPVRGLTRCRNVALLYAIAHNLTLTRKLRAEMATGGN